MKEGWQIETAKIDNQALREIVLGKINEGYEVKSDSVCRDILKLYGIKSDAITTGEFNKWKGVINSIYRKKPDKVFSEKTLKWLISQAERHGIKDPELEE